MKPWSVVALEVGWQCSSRNCAMSAQFTLFFCGWTSEAMLLADRSKGPYSFGPLPTEYVRSPAPSIPLKHEQPAQTSESNPELGDVFWPVPFTIPAFSFTSPGLACREHAGPFSRLVIE